MPVRENGLRRQAVAAENELREELIAELRNPKNEGEPDVIIGHPSPGTIHLFVIWSRWEEMEQLVRSRIILDAFTAARGEEEASDVTISMGLTRAEADRMGIR